MFSLPTLLGYIGLLMQFLALLTGLRQWKKRNLTQRLLVIMVFITLLLQLLAIAIGRVTGNSLWLFHIIGLVEFLFLFKIYQLNLKNFYSTTLLSGIVFFYILFSIFNVLIVQNIDQFPSHARFLESVLIIFFCISYFIYSLRKLEARLIQKTFLFWLSTGLLIYFTSNLLTSLYANMLIQETDYESWQAIWSVHNILNVFLYICFIIAFLQKDEVVINKNSVRG